MKNLFAPLRPALVVLTLGLIPASGSAAPLAFDGSWTEQGFLRLFSNDYIQNGAALDVVSDGTVSLLWRQVDAGQGGATKAAWEWAVAEGVGATDLRRKGGDDRNLALYFVYTDPQTAAGLTRSAARRLLRDPNTTALVYVWGGSHARGDVLASPYHSGLRTLIRRPSGTGSFAEQVDLAGDYRKAFGTAPQVLVGIGITADSDDTDGKIRARIQNLRLD